ncbi:MAG: glycosyltransferase [Planctomycetes bacterium]|nr:glycosyltransferase [Planctomycetota bacterium]MBI3846259.1 glycosyltransferase [Planctomycetota bacterium]
MSVPRRIPRVSVVIPTWNREQLVLRAVRSALAQTYRNIEVIVVDDGSTDGTFGALKEVASTDPRLLVVPSEHTGLPAAARNRGIDVARGRYVAFLDSDDEWLPGKLETQVAQIESRPGLCLTYSDAWVEENESRRATTLLEAYPLREARVFGPLVLGNFIPTSTVLVRRSALRLAGGFDEARRLRAFEDYDLWLRISLRGEIGCIREPLAVYHRHGSNLSKDVLHDNLKRRAILKRFAASRADLSSAEHKIVRAGMARVLKNLGRECIRRCKARRSRAFLGSSIRTCPLQLASYLFLLVSFLGERGSARLVSFMDSGRA